MANRRSLALRRDGANAGLRPYGYLKRVSGPLSGTTIATGLSQFTSGAPTGGAWTVMPTGGPGDPLNGFQRVTGAVATSSDRLGAGLQYGQTNPVIVEQGKTYSFGAYVKRSGEWPSGVVAQTHIRWYNAGGSHIGSATMPTFVPTTEWAPTSVSGVPVADAAYARGFVTVYGSPGSATPFTLDLGDFGWWEGSGPRPQEGVFDSALRSDFIYIPEELVDPSKTVKIVVEDTSYTSTRISFDPMSVPADVTFGNPTEISIVRSPSGFPVTQLDGIELGRYPWQAPAEGVWVSIPDTDLAPGNWQYYGLFAKYESAGNTMWLRMGTASILLPAMFRSADWMWERIPEWYRRQDGAGSDERGLLRKVIDLLGYEFDLHRTWCATVGDVWDVEKVSAKLLPALGYVMGQPAEYAAGDKRYRNVLSNIILFRKQKGTDQGIEDFLSALSGYPTLSYPGLNMLLTVDDSEFRGGSGQWSRGDAVDTFARVAGDAGVGGPTAAEFQLRLTAGAATLHTQMFVSPADTGAVDRHKFIPVKPGQTLKCSFLRKSTLAGAMQVRYQWYDAVGTSILSSDTVAAGTVTTGWTRAVTSTAVTVPAGARFLRLIIERTAATSTNGLQTHIARIMLVDTQWRPEGVPGTQNLEPLSGTNPGHYDDVNYYESARMVHVNVYPQRINLAKNSNFELDNIPEDAWVVSDRPTLRLIPVAYDSYNDITDGEPGDSEESYTDLGQDLAPLAASWSIDYDTVGKRMIVTPRLTAPHTAQVSSGFFPLVEGSPVSAALLAHAREVAVLPPYLDATVGTVSTPDVAVRSNIRVTAKVRKNTWSFPGTGTSYYLAGIRTSGGSGRWSWFHYSTPSSHSMYHDLWPGGTRSPANSAVASGSALTALTPAGQDSFIGAEFLLSSNGAARSRAIDSADGLTWDTVGVPKTGPDATIGVDPALLTIGSAHGTSGVFNGRVYWMQMEEVNRRRFVFPGMVGNRISVPKAVTPGDLQVVIRLDPTSWRHSSIQTIAATYLTTGGNRSWRLDLSTGGNLTLFVSLDGVAVTQIVSSAVIPSNVGPQYVRFTRVASTGEVTFERADDADAEPTSWTPIGTPRPGPAGALFNPAADLSIGQLQAVGTEQPFSGRIRRVIVRPGAGQPALIDVSDINAAEVSQGATSFVASTGQAVTVTQAPGVALVQEMPDQLLWRFDAKEYPGSGTTWTDPRGRQWTLSNAAALVTPEGVLQDTTDDSKLTMRVAWFADDSLAEPVIDPVTNRPAISHVETFHLSNSPQRYELRNALPPEGSAYGRLILSFDNVVDFFTAYVSKVLIENAPVPGAYFDGDLTDGAFGDFFFTGLPHQSPSVYYTNFRSYINGVGGSDRISTVMKELLPPGRDFTILHAGNGLYT